MLLLATNISNAQEDFDGDTQDTNAVPINDYIFPMILVAVFIGGFKFIKFKKRDAI